MFEEMLSDFYSWYSTGAVQNIKKIMKEASLNIKKAL